MASVCVYRVVDGTSLELLCKCSTLAAFFFPEDEAIEYELQNHEFSGLLLSRKQLEMVLAR